MAVTNLHSQSKSTNSTDAVLAWSVNEANVMEETLRRIRNTLIAVDAGELIMSDQYECRNAACDLLDMLSKLIADWEARPGTDLSVRLSCLRSDLSRRVPELEA